ncbi:MAG TPA: hypothetical protein VGI39_11335 [Polyangiaceae bacterium]
MSSGCGSNGDVPVQTPVVSADAAPPPDAAPVTPVTLPVPLASAKTTAPATVAAGDTIVVSCVVVDIQGNVLQPPQGATPDIVFAPADSVQTDSSGATIAARAGAVDVRCSFPSLGVGDDVGAQIAITPGPVASVDTALSATSLVAGNAVTATCTAHDAFNNEVPNAQPTLTSAPTDGGNVITGLSGTFTRAGLYDVACALPGAQTRPVSIEVVPGLPASLVVSPNPVSSLYPVGSVVSVEALVADAYNNPIPLPEAQYASAPSASATLGDRHFQYLSDGFYTLTATVPPPTTTGQPLVAQVQIQVGGVGPTISCDSPADGTMLNAAPGSVVTFGGSANTPNGVATVTVNGAAATLSGTTFSAPLTTRFGVNFADIVATDKNGAQSTRTCAFLVANQWAPESGLYADTIDLKLTQGAVDDGNHAGGLNSFGDLLYDVANSSGLASTLDSALKSANPLKPSSCDSQTCTFLGCVCWYSSAIDYQGLSLPGPQTVDLTLVNGGLTAHVHVPNAGVNLHVYGDVGPVPYDTSGWATFSYLDVTMTLDTSLANGKLHAAVRPGSVTTSVGSVSTSFGGLDGWIINNILVPLVQGTLQNDVSSLVTNYITNNFDSVVDGVLSGLDISTLGTSFNVPQLGGTGTIPLSLGIGFSTLSTTSSRLLVGIASRLMAPAAQALPSLGVPIPSGTVLDDLAVGAPSTAGVAVHVGVFNQALHALWRGGMFNATLTGTQLGGGLPAAAVVQMTTALPPVADISGSSVELSLGGLQLAITYPGLFGGTDGSGNPVPPLDVGLGARATAIPTLVGSDLHFGSLTLGELHFSTGDVSLDQSTNQVLTSLLQTLLQQLVDQSLNNSLPALPIPSFPLPASLQSFGIGPGNLGIANPSLGFDPNDFLLRGQLGLL